MDQTQIEDVLLSFLGTGPVRTGDGAVAPLADADWEDLLQLSARHGVAPLLYHRLRTFHPDLRMPAAALGRLRQAYLDNSARNLGLYHNLGKVLKVLAREHIPVIVLKGAHLAELVYGNRALRFMGDLDLMVKQDDLMRVDALLLEMGCDPTDHNRVVGKDNNEFVYVMPKRDVCLEVHWSILSSQFPFAIDTAGQWERARPVVIEGIAASVLCPEDLLLHLCLHAGCTHGFEPGLKLFCDIREILQHQGGGVDWGIVQRRAREWGCKKCVSLTLRLTRNLLRVDVPEGVMETLKPRDFEERFVVLALNQIFSRRPAPSSPLSLWPAVARFWGATRLRDKVLLFLKGFFLPRETMARLYPVPADSVRSYFYYFVRLRDLLRVYGRDAWRWLRRDEAMQSLAREGRDLTLLKDWLTLP